MRNIQLSLNEKGHGAFTIAENGKQLAEMVIAVSAEAVTVYHTEVVPEAEGKGLAKQLFDEMIAYARSKNLLVVPLCLYVLAQFKRHPQEFASIWLHKSADAFNE